MAKRKDLINPRNLVVEKINNVQLIIFNYYYNS